MRNFVLSPDLFLLSDLLVVVLQLHLVVIFTVVLVALTFSLNL